MKLIEFKDVEDKVRYINPKYIHEVCPGWHSKSKIVFGSGYCNEINVDIEIEEVIKRLMGKE